MAYRENIETVLFSGDYMIRRTLMRRAYNRGDYSKARFHASKIVNDVKEEKVAQSVIIRSFFNEQNFHEVIRLNEQWHFEFESLAQRAKYHLSIKQQGVTNVHHPRILNLHESQPSPSERMNAWKPNNACNNFFQEGNRVWMRHPHGWTYWDMPLDYNINETHPDLLRLTSELLLYPWEKSVRSPLDGTRQKGENLSLSFSAGTDSTAAAMVMPQSTILGYHRRDFDSILDHRKADRMMSHLATVRNRDIIEVPSNHELIRTYRHKQIGFSSDFACGTHLILLADHLDIGAIAFGMPLDNTWLIKGRKFREFSETKYFHYWNQRFASAGLDLVLPIAGISEAGAMMICVQEKLLPYLNSCMRGDDLKGCGKCWKCFHKNGPLGRPFDVKSKEIQAFLNRRPLPTATHALWALQQMGLEEETPDLQPLLNLDYSWWTSYYPPAREILPQRWEKQIWESVTTYLDPMQQPYSLQEVNHFDE